MTSKQTYYRKVRIQSMQSCLISLLNILQLPYSRIDKIPLDSLLNMELKLKGWSEWAKASDRYMHERYISANEHDGMVKGLRKT